MSCTAYTEHRLLAGVSRLAMATTVPAVVPDPVFKVTSPREYREVFCPPVVAAS